jgi:DNA-binding LacI/PurR family transcriptional regulator
MAHTTMANLGRASQKLAAGLRKRIESGKLLGGDYLPTVRELCAEHEVSIDTVSRALKSLEAEGLIASEPRQGYRVMARAGDPLKGHPLAYVLSRPPGEAWDPFHQMLHQAFQRAAAERGWTLLGVSSGGMPAARIVEQLRTARVCGAVLDTVDRDLLGLVEKAGMPAVMVDCWEEHTSLDAVIQDNYRGGYLAAEYLIGKGHRRIDWFGPVNESPASRERYGGASAALAAHGGELPINCPLQFTRGEHEEQAQSKALEYLARRDRGKAVLALWTPLALGVGEVARQRGLVPGRDIDLVGWAAQPAYAERFSPAFEAGCVPPCVVWSPDDMARTAIARLAQRRENPDLPVLRINIPTILKSGE